MLLRELQLHSHIPPILWCENLFAIALGSNPVFLTRSKHIEVDCHFIREKVVTKQLLKCVPSLDQIADVFTKPLSVSRFNYLKAKLLVSSSPISLHEGDKDPSSDALVTASTTSDMASSAVKNRASASAAYASCSQLGIG